MVRKSQACVEIVICRGVAGPLYSPPVKRPKTVLEGVPCGTVNVNTQTTLLPKLPLFCDSDLRAWPQVRATGPSTVYPAHEARDPPPGGSGGPPPPVTVTDAVKGPDEPLAESVAVTLYAAVPATVVGTGSVDPVERFGVHE